MQILHICLFIPLVHDIQLIENFLVYLGFKKKLSTIFFLKDICDYIKNMKMILCMPSDAHYLESALDCTAHTLCLNDDIANIREPISF